MARHSPLSSAFILVAAGLALSCPSRALADDAAGAMPVYLGKPLSLQKLLPPSVGENLDLNAWGWFSYLHDSNEEEANYWAGDIAFGATQRLGDRVALTANMHWIDDNNHRRGFLEQAFVTILASEDSGSLITAGKFNAAFGAEPRDPWNRLTGSTSLLFGAQPQDLVGILVTQPLNDRHFTLRSFLATQFEGHVDIHQAPLGGFSLEYRPHPELTLAFTNFVTAGARPAEDDDDEAGDPYGGGGISNAYEYDTGDFSYGNWMGPKLYARPGGTMYFASARAQWKPRTDLTLAGEGLMAITGESSGQLGWCGALFLANYDITDQCRVFGRWSFLNDPQGLVAAARQQRQEVTTGVGYKITGNSELLFEYRHDFAHTGDLDSLSLHLMLSF